MTCFCNSLKEMNMKITAIALILVLGLAATGSARAAAVTTIRLATVAPEGTSLHKTLQIMSDKWRKLSGGAVTIKILPGGVAGGEARVVSKMRVGEIEAAMLSVEGLSKIDPSVSALE